MNRSALERLDALPALTPSIAPTLVEELSRLRDALHADPRLLIKRDDAIPFGFGGNKIRLGFSVWAWNWKVSVSLAKAAPCCATASPSAA